MCGLWESTALQTCGQAVYVQNLRVKGLSLTSHPEQDVEDVEELKTLQEKHSELDCVYGTDDDETVSFDQLPENGVPHKTGCGGRTVRDGLSVCRTCRTEVEIEGCDCMMWECTQCPRPI